MLDLISKVPQTVMSFKLFGISHWLAITFLVISIGLATKLAGNSDVFRKRYRLFLLLALPIQEILFKAWAGFYQTQSLADVFSLHLCSMAIIILTFLFLNYKQWLFEVVYFWGLAGATQAILTPDITLYGFPHFRFFQVFFSHGLIIASVLYFLLVEKKTLYPGALKRVFLITNLYTLLVFPINLIFKTNYLFIGHKPETASLIDMLGPWPWYILSLDVVALILFSLVYLPFTIKHLRFRADS